MAQPYVCEIRMFCGNFAPSGWAFCNGQLLAISENEAMFNLIGTTYGGDGQFTFALPDLRSRAPIGTGSGSGLTPRALSAKGGAESVTLQGTTKVTGSGATAIVAGTPIARTVSPYLAVNFIISMFGIYPTQ